MMSKNLNNCNDCNNWSNDISNNIYPIGSCLLSLPPKQFALLSSLLGIILKDDLNTDQQNALGNFIVNIGQSILTAAAQEQSQQNNNSQNDQILQEIDSLKNQVSLLKKELDNQK